MLKHTGEKPFNCTIFNAKFAQRCNLETLMLRRSGEKPFKCTLFNAKFTQRGGLKTHMLRHTGEKPFIKNTYADAHWGETV